MLSGKCSFRDFSRIAPASSFLWIPDFSSQVSRDTLFLPSPFLLPVPVKQPVRGCEQCTRTAHCLRLSAWSRLFYFIPTSWCFSRGLLLLHTPFTQPQAGRWQDAMGKMAAGGEGEMGKEGRNHVGQRREDHCLWSLMNSPWKQPVGWKENDSQTRWRIVPCPWCIISLTRT